MLVDMDFHGKDNLQQAKAHPILAIFPIDIRVIFSPVEEDLAIMWMSVKLPVASQMITFLMISLGHGIPTNMIL